MELSALEVAQIRAHLNQIQRILDNIPEPDNPVRAWSREHLASVLGTRVEFHDAYEQFRRDVGPGYTARYFGKNLPPAIPRQRSNGRYYLLDTRLV